MMASMRAAMLMLMRVMPRFDAMPSCAPDYCFMLPRFTEVARVMRRMSRASASAALMSREASILPILRLSSPMPVRRCYAVSIDGVDNTMSHVAAFKSA